jgi:hypothetical protein
MTLERLYLSDVRLSGAAASGWLVVEQCDGAPIGLESSHYVNGSLPRSLTGSNREVI